MGKGFSLVSPKKPKGNGIISTLSPEETQMVLSAMYEFLGWNDNIGVLGRMAMARYANGEGRGAIVAAPWQHEDPELIPTHYMVESELRAAGLAYQTVIDSLKRYKPHSEFVVIYWKQDQPKTLASCQIIGMGVPLIKLFKLQQLGGKHG